MKNRKKHIHKKFNKIVNKAANSNDTKKYKVSKLSKDKYSYHDFVIVKIEDDTSLADSGAFLQVRYIRE